MSSNPQVQLPEWVPVVVNIFIGIVLIGAFVFLYGWGAWFTWQNRDVPTEAIKIPQVVQEPLTQSLISTVGGFISGLFAVTLNLSKSPLPTSIKDFGERAIHLMTLFQPRPTDQNRPQSLVIDWKKLNDNILRVVGIILVLSYPPLVIVAAVFSVFLSRVAPDFFVSFGTVGSGVMFAAFILWSSRLIGNR